MKYQICHMSIGLFLTSAPIIAQGVFEADGVRYEIWDSAQHTVAIMPTERCGITEGYDHDNTINIVRVKSSVQNNGTGYRVVAIKDSAFTGRTDIDRLIIEDGIEEIGASAFAGCKYLEEVSLPSTVISIAHAAFSGCDRLCRITVAQGNDVYDSRGNCNAVIETKSDKLVVGCNATNIPDNIKTIGHYAFSEIASLSEIKLPARLMTIEGAAFHKCVNLKSVNLSQTLQTIGEYAFEGTALTEIFIPSNVDKIGLNPFIGCENLQSITVDKGNSTYDSRDHCNSIIDTKRQRLIAGCKNSVIPKRVRSIASFAFVGHTGLTRMVIPKSVEDISPTAFSGCVNLTELSVEKGNPVYDSRNDCNAVIETNTQTLRIACSRTVIPNDIVAIGDGAFSGMNTSTSLHIPQNIKEIGNSAFKGCGNLRSLFVDTPKVIFGQYCFAGCQELETVQLPVGTNVIPRGMFKGCSKLTNIDIPFGCQIIESSAFENCRNLRSITMPTDAIMSGENQFKGVEYMGTN